MDINNKGWLFEEKMPVLTTEDLNEHILFSLEGKLEYEVIGIELKDINKLNGTASLRGHYLKYRKI